MEETQLGLRRWRQVQTHWITYCALCVGDCRFDISLCGHDPCRWRILGGCTGSNEYLAANNYHGGDSVSNHLFPDRYWTSEFGSWDANVQ